ncbi:MAG: PKD domain-containing protein [Cytophagaceae bacterium]|nr:PKD domain-containing protein [Cytophagaceae bacterium]
MLLLLFFSLCLVVVSCKLDDLPGDKRLLEKPTAAFSVTNDGCTATCPITFTSQAPTATSYLWQVSDGSTSTQPSFVRTFTAGGVYTVKLTVTNKAGSTTTQQTVTVKAAAVAAPIADFSFTGGDCTAPCEVSFTNKSSNATNYQWNFGDNTTSTEASPRRTYAQGGTFTVTLTANGAGGTNVKTQSVTIKSFGVSRVWDRTFGGSAEDVLLDMVATSDGGFVLSGFSRSGTSTDKSQPSKGEQDYWVVKINASGIRQWDKTYGGSSLDFLDAVAATDNGSLLLGGHSYSNQGGDKTEAPKGLGDYWVVKLNASGDKQWDRTFGGSSLDFLHSIAFVKSDGGFLLGGQSGSGQGGDKSQPSKGNDDYWVVKIDANGVKQWDKTFGGTEKEELTSVIATSDGGFLLAGQSSSTQSGDRSEPSRGGIDYWVVKIDANGLKKWDKRFGGNGDDKLNSVVATDGNFLLVGSSGSGQGGDKAEASRGDLDYWVVKINADGAKQWDKTFGGSGADEAFSVVVNADGSFILAGHSKSGPSGEKSEASKGNQEADYWVVKVDASGNKVWDKTFGGNGKEELTSMVASPADGSFMLGGFSKSDASGDKSEASKGLEDYWVVKIK